MSGPHVVAITARHSSMKQYLLPVGLAPVIFPTPEKQPTRIFIQSVSTNTVPILVGLSTVQADYSQGGFEYPVGANAYSPYTNPLELYAVASAANQKLLISYFFGVE